jgi:hypothetical protein
MPLTKLLDPRPIPPDFIWSKRMFHLTYKGHIPTESLLSTVRHATSIHVEGWSVCHEISEDEYEHSHLALIFAERLKLVGSWKFDVHLQSDPNDPNFYSVIHPHAMPKVTMLQMQQLVLQYHAGRKFSLKTGKLEYTAPVLHETHFPLEWEWARVTIAEIVAAPSLSEACVVGSIRPRSVSDVRLLRAEAAKAPKIFKHKFSLASFKPLLPVPLPRVIWIHGGSGIGKSKLAAALFSNPCFCKPCDSLGCLEYIKNNFDPTVHDGLVLDEADLRFLSRSQAIALCDHDEDCVMSVRFTHFELPCTVPRVFVSNPAPDKVLPKDEFGAILRRIHVLHVTEPTFFGASPAHPVLPVPNMAPRPAPAGPVTVYRSPTPVYVSQNYNMNNRFASPFF